jgi:hypothetical protein
VARDISTFIYGERLAVPIDREFGHVVRAKFQSINWRWLRSIAEKSETNTIMGQAGPLAPVQEIMKQPVVVEIPCPPAALAPVQEDLTLTVDKAQGPLKWRIDSWHDCPLIQIGDRILGVSIAIRTLAS